LERKLDHYIPPSIPQDMAEPVEPPADSFQSFNSLPLISDDEEDSDCEDDDSEEESDDDLVNEGATKGQLDIFVARLKVKSSVEYARLDAGQTYFPKPDPIVELKKSLRYGGAPSPESSYLVDIHVFAPHITYKGFFPQCPHCGQTLSPKGWASNPRGRRVIGLSECSYLISFRYNCKGCIANDGRTVSFYASTQEMMANMPRYIQLAFPFILTKRKAITLEVSSWFH
jgi:hypothetical protein